MRGTGHVSSRLDLARSLGRQISAELAVGIVYAPEFREVRHEHGSLVDCRDRFAIGRWPAYFRLGFVTPRAGDADLLESARI